MATITKPCPSTFGQDLGDLLAREDLRRLAPEDLRRKLEEIDAARPDPWPVCPRCKSIVHPDELDWLWKRWCFSCGVTHRENLVERVVAKFGRRVAVLKIKALRND
jgi:hypothetical protein